MKKLELTKQQFDVLEYIISTLKSRNHAFYDRLVIPPVPEGYEIISNISKKLDKLKNTKKRKRKSPFYRPKNSKDIPY